VAETLGVWQCDADAVEERQRDGVTEPVGEVLGQREALLDTDRESETLGLRLSVEHGVSVGERVSVREEVEQGEVEGVWEGVEV